MILNDLKPSIDWLTYRSYEHNRKSNPEIAYYRWRSLFADAILFEEIYDRNYERIKKGE